jgi:predicted AAA+ superfamily ATPase
MSRFVSSDLPRQAEHQRVMQALGRTPVVALLGARQVRKTTLARQVAADFPEPTTWFDLEDPDDVARLAEPKLAAASGSRSSAPRRRS